MPSRSTTRCLLALALATMASSGALAQADYPARPITTIVPYGPGSSTDIMGRATGDHVARVMGGTSVPINRDGASGVVGMTALMNAVPDGYTIAFTPMVPVAVQPHLVKDSKVNPDTVQPVCGVTENILGIAVRTDAPWKTAQAFVEASRARPLTFGSGGPNSAPSLAIAELGRRQKVEFVHAPFRADAAVLAEVLAGRLDFGAIIAGSATPFVNAGQMRLLALFSTRRHPGFPDVPTLQELGFGVVQLSYAGVFAPRGLPAAILARLEKACAEGVTQESFRTIAANVNQTLEYQPRDRWEKRVRDEFKAQGEALRAIGAVAK